jgi:hypothetical protein
MRESEREKLVAGMVGTGMERDRARLAVDLAVQAHTEALGAVERVCGRAPDPGNAMAALEIAMQLIAHDFIGRVQALHEKFGAVPRAVTAIEL